MLSAAVLVTVIDGDIVIVPVRSHCFTVMMT